MLKMPLPRMPRVRATGTVLVFLLAPVLLSGACFRSGGPVRTEATPAASVAPPTAMATPAPGVRLVPLEDFPQRRVERLAQHIQERYGIPVTVLPPVTISDKAVDVGQLQLVGERVVDEMAAALLPAQEGSVVIGLTQYDMRIDLEPNWRWTFSYRDGSLGLAVVSTAHMDPRNYGQSPDEALLFARLSKMVAKNVGVLYLRLPPSEDPRSVMYNNILGLDDLDAMGEDFTPP